jgi:hypothetical protein
MRFSQHIYCCERSLPRIPLKLIFCGRCAGVRVSLTDSTASKCRAVDECLERDAIRDLDFTEALSQHSPDETKENHDKSV